MRWLRRLRARLKYRRFDAELREEIDLHRAMVEADLRSRGASPTEARAAASRAMGNVTLAREEARAVWLAPWLDGLWQDSRYALRSLRKSPGFALTAVLTLGAGIGLNVSLFTIFNTLAVQGWNARRAHEIVVPFSRPVGTRGFRHWFPYAEYVSFREQTTTLASVVAHSGGSARLFQSEGTDYGRPFDHVQFQGVSANYFDALGIDIAQGRGFLPGEDVPGVPASIVVLTHAFWQNQLNADPRLSDARCGWVLAMLRSPLSASRGLASPVSSGSLLLRCSFRCRCCARLTPTAVTAHGIPPPKGSAWRDACGPASLAQPPKPSSIR